MERFGLDKSKLYLYGMIAVLVLLSAHGQVWVTIHDICPMRQHDMTETAWCHADSTINCVYIIVTTMSKAHMLISCNTNMYRQFILPSEHMVMCNL